MDDLNKEKNKSKEDKTHTKELHQENKQSSKIIDTSIFDTTLKDIEQILNALEQKIHSGENRLEKINYLPEINSTISKIHVAKNELIKEYDLLAFESVKKLNMFSSLMKSISFLIWGYV